jgi:hypothetical protein
MRRRNARAEAASRQQSWRLALLDRRVVRFFGEMTLKEYETPEMVAAVAAEVEGAQVVTKYKG